MDARPQPPTHFRWRGDLRGRRPSRFEAALPTRSPWYLTDLGAAHAAIGADAPDRMRMADYFMDERPFDAFDGVAHVSKGNSTVEAQAA